MYVPSHVLPRAFYSFLILALSGFAQASSHEFQQVTTFPAGKGPASIALADFNNDGHLDIVTVSESTSTVSVLLNNGDGTFKRPKDTHVGQNPDALAVGDFNRDGKPDIAVTNQSLNTVTILLGKGDGTFRDGGSYGVGIGPTSIVTADFNADGILDLAVVADNQLSVLLGNSDGTFQKAMNSQFAGQFLVAGDFNGDGKIDLASKSGRSLYLALGNGNGTFTQRRITSLSRVDGVGQFLAIDINNDGNLDLVVPTAAGIVVFLGKGNGTFRKLPFSGPKSGAGGIAAGDLNGDGKLDLVLGTTDLLVLLGKGDGTFTTSSDYMDVGGRFFPVVGDLNHDGKLDVVTGKSAGSSVSVYLGNGDGTLQGPRNFNLTFGAVANVLTDDFNGDGKQDLAVNDAVLLGNGDGTFKPAIVNSMGNPRVIADLNRDHIPDLISFGQNGGALVVMLGNGDGTFRQAGEFNTGGEPVYVTLGDFNGDGNLDAAVLNGDNPGNVSVMLGNGDGTFQSPVNYPTTQAFNWFVLNGDFNGDGKLDLVVGSAGGTTDLLLGNGDGTFRAAKVINAAGCFGAVPDLNGDKKLDIVLVGCAYEGSNNDVTVLLGNGNGTFKAPVNYAAGVSGFLKVRDVNGDGKLDVIVPDSRNSGDSVAVLLGNGDGTLQPAQSYFVGDPVSGVGVADFNGDNLLDLAVGNFGHVSILLNTGH